MLQVGDLVLQAMQGDRAALETLLTRYQRPILNFVYRLAGRDLPLAEDLTQDVFLRVVANLDRFDPGRIESPEGAEESSGARAGRAFEKWMYTIARNRVRDQWRATRPEVPLEDDSAAIAADPDPSRALGDAEQERAVEEAIDRLPLAQREVLTLRLHSGLSFAEISEVMGAPLGTSLARMRYALANLKKLLETSS